MVPFLASTQLITALAALAAALLTGAGGLYVGIRKGNLDQRMMLDTRSAKLEERDSRFIDQLQETITELRTVLEQRRQEIREHQADLIAMRDQVRAREDEIATLEATLRAREQEVIQCRERLGQNESRLTDLEAELRVMRREYPAPADMRATISGLQEQLERLRRGGPPATP